MGRPITFDFSVGSGSPEAFLIGTVVLEPTIIHNIGSRIILPDTEVIPLINGKARHPNIANSPAGPVPAWAYKVTIFNDMTGRGWTEYRGVPMGSAEMTYFQLPRFEKTLPPQITKEDLQNYVEETVRAKNEAEEAADRAEAPTDVMVSGLIKNGGSLSSQAIHDITDPLPIGFAQRSEAVLSQTVRRIVAVDLDQPYPPLQDGDLVLEYHVPEQQFFTDFTHNTTGFFPADWSTIWQPGLLATVEGDSSAIGGKALKIVGYSTAARRALTYKPIEEDPSRGAVEIFFRYKTNQTAKTLRAGANIGGNIGGETVLVGGFRNASFQHLATYKDGVLTTLTPELTDGTMPADTYLNVRMRVSGTTVSLKQWTGAISSEPEGWDMTRTNGSVGASGLVGMYTAADILESTMITVDCFGVGIGGVVAPTKAVAS